MNFKLLLAATARVLEECQPRECGGIDLYVLYVSSDPTLTMRRVAIDTLNAIAKVCDQDKHFACVFCKAVCEHRSRMYFPSADGCADEREAPTLERLVRQFLPTDIRASDRPDLEPDDVERVNRCNGSIAEAICGAVLYLGRIAVVARKYSEYTGANEPLDISVSVDGTVRGVDTREVA